MRICVRSPATCGRRPKFVNGDDGRDSPVEHRNFAALVLLYSARRSCLTLRSAGLAGLHSCSCSPGGAAAPYVFASIALRFSHTGTFGFGAYRLV
jgi:hypothetical protein